jgi:hypothetical protein
MSPNDPTVDKLGNVQRTSSNRIHVSRFKQHRPVADFEHDELASATTSIRMTTLCNTARGGKDEIITSGFVLVGNYLYPACVAGMVRRARIGTHEASP